jgi:hypothetical protein
MRYLMVLVGLVCAGAGGYLLTMKPPGVDGFGVDLRHALLVQVGVVLIAAGLATIDVVEALKSRRQ